MTKKSLTFVVICALLLILGIQNQTMAFQLKKTKNFEIKQILMEPVDYSNSANWMYMGSNPKNEVDLIYVYPTATMKPALGSQVGAINDENKKNARFAFDKSGAAFADYTNVYAPYYRQLPAILLPTTSLADVKEAISNSQAKIDVFNALDYYFTNLNKGRPFMISTHSQGSFIMQLAFEEYFSEHPEYLNQMVAAYSIGIPFTKKWLKQNNLQFAKGETDTGVVITWNTEGPNAKGGMGKRQLAINPINWKLDSTPATVAENKGSLMIDMKKQKTTMVDGFADATLNLKRGTVVCTTRNNYLPSNQLFGDKSFHTEDYSLYYQNIKENGLKRIEAFLGHKIK